MPLSGTGQKEYNLKMLEGLAGQPFGSGQVIDPLFLESGTCPFGYGVTAGTAEDQAILPSGGETVADFRGVTLRRGSIERDWRSTEDPVYNAEYENIMDVVLRRGVLVVPTSVVQRGDSVFWQIITNGSNLAGTFRNDADAGNAIDISSVAAWFRSNATLGALAALTLKIVYGEIGNAYY